MYNKAYATGTVSVHLSQLVYYQNGWMWHAGFWLLSTEL